MEISLDVLEKLLPNVLTVVTQLVATFVLFFFMKKLAWQPVREILQKRADYEQKRLTDAQQLKETSEKMNEQARQELLKAGAEAKELISIGKSEAERIRNELIEDAKKKSAEKISDARKEIAYEKDQMRSEIHQEIIDVAFVAAEKLLAEKLDAQTDRQEIADFVKEVVKK
ncbi:MAG: F0F1 ATP synthase subunit B [Erysipelotrichaceae bacterium]|nr:F0F1 ATP synthase subunit B [Erysipelotrichaceae bacterium]